MTKKTRSFKPRWDESGSAASRHDAFMLSLARWCIAHRGRVVVAWLAVAVLTTTVAGSIGNQYATNFDLPGTESQHASDLLERDFRAQSGDVDTIVFHVSHGTIDAPSVRTAIVPVLARVSGFPHVAGVISPYSSRGAIQVSPGRMTAFATINYDKAPNLVPNDTSTRLLDRVNGVHVPGLQVAAGGQVVENAEGFGVGPATAVGTIAALVILLLTFGSLMAAGMPLITAGLGLIPGVALIGLATHLTTLSNISPQLALMIGLGVGIDYALFIVTRFRENYLTFGDVQRSVVEAMDTSGRAILLAGDRSDRPAGHVRHRAQLHGRPDDRRGHRRPAHACRRAHAAARTPVALRLQTGASAWPSAPDPSPPSRGRRRRRQRRAHHAAPVGVAALEQGGAIATLAAGDRLLGGDDRVIGPRLCAATGQQRRRQRPAQRQLASRL